MRAVRSSFLMLIVALTIAGWAQPIHILSTGDMHGWLQGQTVDGQLLGGAAEMLAYWRQQEHYRPNADFLTISCGDIATGPALSTALKGDPVIDVMNRMGYTVTVLGNHEFDFGREHLLTWEKNAKFSFLCANLVKADGAPNDIAVPYIIDDIKGVKVGLIGVTTTEVTAIADTGGLVAKPYAETLRKYVPEMRAKGAQTIIVVAHVPMVELINLAKQVADLNIPLMLGGHSHELGQTMVSGTHTWVINNGEWWKAYTRIDLDYNPRTHNTILLTAKQVWLQQDHPQADTAVQNDIKHWQQQLDAQMGATLGYTVNGLTRPQGVANLFSACYLGMDPTADVVVYNEGGFRQEIAPGALNKGLITGVLPFNNVLYRVSVTGRQLLEYKMPEHCEFTGLRREGDRVVLAKTGQPVNPETTYHLLITDYLYNKSADLKAADPHPVTVAGDYRQPIIEWLTAHPTSKDKPLESIIDVKAPLYP